MVISAHFEPADTASERPRPRRRRLQLEVAGALASGGEASVTIHNISASGLLLETATGLSDGERIDIELPDVGPTTATIVRVSDNYYGGKFDAPLSVGVLSALELRGSAAPQPASAPGETLAVTNSFTSASGAITVPISRPSSTAPPGWVAKARCRS